MRHTYRLSPKERFSHCGIVLFFVALIGMTPSHGSAGQRLAVTGDRVNLRASPYGTAEVVGQVSRTDTLILQGTLTDDWVQVAPPDSIDLWIYANLVKDNTVIVNNAQVRAGAGLNFNVVGQLQSGDTITKRGQVGDWIKIAPFPSASVWITNAYVRLERDAESVPNTQPAPALASASAPKHISTVPVPVPVTKPEPSIHPPALSKQHIPAPSIPPSITTPKHPAPKRTLLGAGADATLGPAKIPVARLRQNVGQAASGSYSGTLTLVPHGNHPTKYRLVSFEANNMPQTVCYVLGNRRQLDALKNSVFTIEGAVYWFNGTELPTVFAQNILRHKAP